MVNSVCIRRDKTGPTLLVDEVVPTPLRTCGTTIKYNAVRRSSVRGKISLFHGSAFWTCMVGGNVVKLTDYGIFWQIFKV